MATSLVATGVQFPDATIQTTAAGAGGSSLEAIASGSLSDGSTVIVNADGTVSVVVGVAQAVGSPVVFESADTRYTTSTYDVTNNKVVIAYRDVGNSSYGTAVVGTVSGTSISFGTPVVFESAVTGTYITSTYDSTNSKIVIVYNDNGNSNYGTAIVGTVSGTSISFGTAVVFESASTSFVSATYDSTNQKVVIAYSDFGNAGYGTAIVGTVSGTSISFGTAVVFATESSTLVSNAYDPTSGKVAVFWATGGLSAPPGYAIIGTVSGTSISFGSSVVFNATRTGSAIKPVYDSYSNKIIVFYGEGDGLIGETIVGTISGTSISFGTAVVFNSVFVDQISASYDSTNNKIVIAYQDGGTSNYGVAIVGTVNGTSISFGSKIVFNSAITAYISTTYDSTNDKVVISYLDNGNSNFGTSVVFQNASVNLTSENYIGISDGAYTDTQTATIQLVGSVDDAQSGLTAGQKYYVQTDGTLSETPATPSVLAGTAQSATKLIIKR